MTYDEYRALPDSLRAGVAIKTLKAIGRFFDGMPPRELTREEVAHAEEPTDDMREWAENFRRRFSKPIIN